MRRPTPIIDLACGPTMAEALLVPIDPLDELREIATNPDPAEALATWDERGDDIARELRIRRRREPWRSDPRPILHRIEATIADRPDIDTPAARRLARLIHQAVEPWLN
jgi:hypothetical protein